MADQQERQTMTFTAVSIDAHVYGDLAPTRAHVLKDGRLHIEWDQWPSRVHLYGMTPAHARNLAQILVGLAIEAEGTEVAA